MHRDTKGALSLAYLPLLLGACTTIVDVDEYTFDDDPCPPVTETCATGDRFHYVITLSDITRRTPEGTLDGFDLDGTDREVCDQPDFVSPRGDDGVDNQLSDLAVALEMAGGTTFGEESHALILMGDLQVIELEGIDSLVNDDCVSMRSRTGYVPMGEEPQSYLDPDGDDEVDSGLRLDYGPATGQDPNACIIDGVLHARFVGVTSIPFGEAELQVHQMRMRADVSEAALTDALFGGAVTVEELGRTLDPGGLDVRPIVYPRADLDDDDGQCLSISWAFAFEGLTMVPGDLRR